MKKMRACIHELLQVVDRHVLEVDLFSTIDIGGISEDTNGHPWPGDIWESANTNQAPVCPARGIHSSLDGSREALVSLRVVVFQTDLQFNGLDEVAAFFSRGSKEFLDRAPHA